MESTILLNGEKLKVDLNTPLDISIPLRNTVDNVTAWWAKPPKFSPVMENGFIGDVNQGGSVNFKEVYFNPHGNGTHTECVGHISKENYTINQCLKKFIFKALLVTINPRDINGDKVIMAENLKGALSDFNGSALIIRTLPNSSEKLKRQYSDTNPPYIDTAAIDFMNEKGIRHLLIDTPSIDREDDGGKVAAHHRFCGRQNGTGHV